MLKFFLILLCCTFLRHGYVFAQTAAIELATVAPDVCQAGQVRRLNTSQYLEVINVAIQEAIDGLDSAKVELSSKILASGKMAYLSVSPNLGDNLKNICILGYFEIDDIFGRHMVPLFVDHVEIFKTPVTDGAEKTVEKTRIYFRVPYIRDFPANEERDKFWKFWTRFQAISLKIAVWDYQNEKRLNAYFGRDMKIDISHKNASIVASWLFAFCCYFILAIIIAIYARPSFSTNNGRELSKSEKILNFLNMLTPWQVVATGGKASLSQLQLLIFTIIVASLLFYQWLRTGELQELSTDLLYLIGISTIGAGGSQVTASIKRNFAPAVYEYVLRLGWFSAPPIDTTNSANLSELLLTNQRFDVYKFQMLVFSTVIAAAVVSSGAQELGNVQISSTLLTLMGISQGAYWGGHAISDYMTQLQDQLRSMETLQGQWNEATPDSALRLQLEKKFESAAKRAASLFAQIFELEVSPEMQRIG